MKSSIFIAGASAAMAFAMPADKREIHTQVDVVYEWDTVTVTAGSEPTPAPVAKQAFYAAGSQPKQQQKQNYPVQKAPEPDVVVVTVEIVTITEGAPEPTVYSVAPSPQAPAPQPSTQQAPAPVASDYPTPNRPVAANNMESASVDSHNMHRSNHSAPAATWNSRIAGYAANTAATCKYAHDMKQGDADYGQNIAMWGLSSGAEKLGDVGAINMAIHDMWYNGELNLFSPSFYGESSPDMTNFEKWGHFSQLVWKESTSVGCQAQFCPKGTMNDGMDTWFMVCNYFPAGNVGGAYGKNVLKPLGKAKVVA
ncbi:uncharacterized protein PG998_011581 [Apiospora kogelbergensis]|uniref:uncharacterized protein n=1 Tax=Apiospora kogelbergensis TaxID=1337665 RepID=UPI003131276A